MDNLFQNKLSFGKLRTNGNTFKLLVRSTKLKILCKIEDKDCSSIKAKTFKTMTHIVSSESTQAYST